MTTIFIPEAPSLKVSLADHDCHMFSDRQYLYLAGDRLVVVVILEAAEAISQELNGFFDCSIGNHGADAPLGFTSPLHAGKTHSKITIRKRLPEDSTPDITWGEFLAGAPDASDTEPFQWRSGDLVTQTELYVPDLVYRQLFGYAARRGMDLSQLLWLWAEEMLEWDLE